MRKTIRNIDDLGLQQRFNRAGGLMLERADLRNADLSVNALKKKYGDDNQPGVNLAYANLRYADLTGADLTGTILIDVDGLSTAINADTTNAILTEAALLAMGSKEQITGGKNRKIRNKTRKTYKKRKNKKRKMLNKKRRLKTRKMK